MPWLMFAPPRGLCVHICGPDTDEISKRTTTKNTIDDAPVQPDCVVAADHVISNEILSNFDIRTLARREKSFGNHKLNHTEWKTFE